MKTVKAALSHNQCAIDVEPCPYVDKPQIIEVPVRSGYFLATDYRCSATLRPIRAQYFLDEPEYFEWEH